MKQHHMIYCYYMTLPSTLLLINFIALENREDFKEYMQLSWVNWHYDPNK